MSWLGFGEVWHVSAISLAARPIQLEDIPGRVVIQLLQEVLQEPRCGVEASESSGRWPSRSLPVCEQYRRAHVHREMQGVHGSSIKTPDTLPCARASMVMAHRAGVTSASWPASQSMFNVRSPARRSTAAACHCHLSHPALRHRPHRQRRFRQSPAPSASSHA